jgi:hypothetical protein
VIVIAGRLFHILKRRRERGWSDSLSSLFLDSLSLSFLLLSSFFLPPLPLSAYSWWSTVCLKWEGEVNGGVGGTRFGFEVSRTGVIWGNANTSAMVRGLREVME